MGKIKVRVHETYPTRDNSCPIGDFFGLLRTFARVWRTKIIADFPDTRPRQNTQSDHVAIHFFYRNTGNNTHENTITDILGYRSSAPLRRWEAHPFWGAKELGLLQDFSGGGLAHVKERSLYIDFDFLKNTWEGHEAVLTLILHFGLARILAPELGDNGERAGRELAEILSAGFTSRKDAVRASFISILDEFSGDALVRAEREIKTRTIYPEISELETKWVELEREILRLEEQIARLEKTDTSADLEKEFDTILNLRGVARADVREEKLVVTTRRIGQIYPPYPPMENSSYDLGAWEIRIDPADTRTTAVQFRPLARGTHTNGHFFDSPVKENYLGVCFGGDTRTGLNAAINKLLSDSNLPSLLGTVLTFMRLVDSKPALRTEKIPKDELDYEPSSYESEGAYEAAKRDYVKLVRAIKLNRSTKAARYELSKAREDLENVAAGFQKKREELRSCEALIQFLVERRNDSRRAHDAFEDLLRQPSVIVVDVLEQIKSIWVWLFDRESFPYPMLVWISPDFLPRIFYPYRYYGRRDDHNLEFGIEAQKELIGDLAAGDLAKLLEKTIRHVTQPNSDPA